MKKILIVAATTTLMMTMSSCRQNHQQGTEQQKAEAQKAARYEALLNEAWESKDEHLLPVIDSLEAVGELTAARADYARGMTYDRARHVKVGERYYAKVYETTDPEKEGWFFYKEVGNRLAQIRMSMGDFKGSLAVATDILDRAEKAGKLTDDNKADYLWSIAACQDELGLDEAEQTRTEVYRLLEQEAKKNGPGGLVSLLIYTYVITDVKMGQGHYDEAEKWLKKADNLLKQLNQPGDSAVVREYTSQLSMARVRLLEGQKKGEEAYAFFQKSLPLIVISPECVSQAADYLLEKGKYVEAADLYNHIDKNTPADNKESEMNLDNIRDNIIPRLQANIGAERTDSVVSIARRLADNYGLAMDKEREGNAAELAIIYQTQQKDAEIAQQQLSLSRQRWIGTLSVLILLTAFFIIYTLYRRRSEKRLSTAHTKLQQAYDQLEETTAAKERIESELRIARDIQMSMVPGIFPECDGLDMYAEMTPAKEVGGDLYGYVMQGNRLYFCVGDVSGKGVPASLFMAQSSRLFRTLATEGMMPADIATRMNDELAEGNDSNMFVTMFIGLLHLDTGRLDFCNCGHNPPILDADFLMMKHVNQMIGFAGGVPFVGETRDDIRGKKLLIYTDGLNEAENRKKEQFGDKRIQKLMTDSANLSSRQVINMLKKAVQEHRAGTEPNDDLTLMCISLKA